MSVFFDRAAEWILAREGEWGKVPNDRGGRTRFGISERSFPNVDLDTLTWPGAKELYRTEFWAKVKGDSLGWPLGLVVFDWAVISGALRPVMELQRAVGVKADGIIGPKTLAAMVRLPAHQTALRLLAERVDFHVADWNLNQEQPLEGWMNRVVLLGVELGKSAA